MKLLLICLDGVRADLALPEHVAANPLFVRPDHPADPRFASEGSVGGQVSDHTLTLEQAREFGVLAPTLNRLARSGERSDGRVLPMWMTPPTDSGPGWSSILTGSTHEQVNVWWNEFVGHRLAERPDVLTQVWAANPAARTMVAADWDAFAAGHGPGPMVQQRIDQQRTGQHKVFQLPEADLARTDAEVRTKASWVLNHEGPDASIVYMQNTDHQGHLHGADSEQYREAIQQADEHVRYLVKAVAERHEALGEDWLVAVTTDHGHKPEGGHGEDEVEVRRSFVILHRIGGRLPEWLDEVGVLHAPDVTPLLLRLLGIVPARWEAGHEVGVVRDVVSVGPSRDLDFEW